MDFAELGEENQNYLQSKLKGIIEPMVAQILLSNPTNVRKFMLEWLTKTYNRSNDLDPKVEDKVESEFEKSIEVISLNL